MTLQNILIEKILANQITFQLYDCSKIMVGDRWQVRLMCKFTVKISDPLWQTVGDFPNKDSVMEMLGTELTHEQVHERQFVADTEKDDVIKEVIQQIENDILPYSGGHGFAEALLKKRVKEARLQLVTGAHLSTPSPEDVEEPADFSHLFK